MCFLLYVAGRIQQMGKNMKNVVKSQEKKDKEKFNSVTNKKDVENQNQTHNVRDEGIGPENQRR